MNSPDSARLARRLSLVGLLAALMFNASPSLARQDGGATVRTFVEGRITVSSEIDSTANYEGFEVVVAGSGGSGIDTLGYAVTDRTGAFAMEVSAPRRGVYALIIKRLDQILGTDEIVIAQNDSVRVSAVMPLGGRPVRLRSVENAAWLAFRNTDAQHNQHLMELLRQEAGDEATLELAVSRSADLFWSLQRTFPGTLGAAAGAVKSVTMLEGWNDSLVVARSTMLDADAPGFVEAVRAAHRATARLDGLDAAISLVEDAMRKTDRPESLAALEATVVQAHLDSLQGDRAAIASRSIQQAYEGSTWAIWAQRAEYEAKNLMPGMPAPDFSTTTRDDQEVSLNQLRGKPVVLEFWDPQDEAYRNQAPQIAALAQEFGSVQWIFIGLNPDADLIDAFLEGRELPGLKLQDTAFYDSPLARLYNVNSLPTRVLIDGEGRIVKKYLGDSLYLVAEDVQVLLAEN